jgi:hypothetical protein
MTKGLPRSMSRGSASRQEVVKQTIAVRNASLTLDGATGVGFGSVVIGDLPEGNILLLGAVAYFAFAGAGGQATLSETWNGDYAVGTTPASDGTLSAADIDIIGSTPTTVAVAEVSPRTRGVSVTATNVAVLDNTDGSLELNLSLLIDDADVSADDLVFTVNGELHLAYILLGDD